MDLRLFRPVRTKNKARFYSGFFILLITDLEKNLSGIL